MNDQKFELLVKENISSIREIQKNPSKALIDITRVVRGSQTMGFFFSNEEYAELMEDKEASRSKELKARVKKVRLSSSRRHSLKTVAAEYGI